MGKQLHPLELRALTIACESCDAPPGEWCRVVRHDAIFYGRKTNLHAPRIQAAKRQS